MRAIYLIGFMGTGKTTIGKALGQVLQLPVFDSDEEICKKANKTINEIFAESGEKYFRKLEADTLRKLPATDAIITTGGGIVLAEENRLFMRANGKVILLTADLDEIYKRIVKDYSRPLLHGDKKEKMFELYHQRETIYESSAHIQIDTTNLNVEEIVNQIEKGLKE